VSWWTIAVHCLIYLYWQSSSSTAFSVASQLGHPEWADPGHCGIGLPKVSDLAQKFKWNNLLSCQALGLSPIRCMNEQLDCIPDSKHPCATPINVISPRHIAVNSTTDFKMGARFIARSVLEWTKEPGILIASHVYEDHQTVRDCIDNTNTNKKYAQEAQLWPYEEIFGKVKVLRDVKFYMTDGYFTVKTSGTKDIITSKQNLRDAGKGAGGIILMPRNPTDQVLGLHIKIDKPQPGMNAYT
jgi:hypothetical protein